jgi:cyclic pyranopterin phosphate synthase
MKLVAAYPSLASRFKKERSSMYDRYNRRINYLRISVTDRCNLRCTYCMSSEGVTLLAHSDILSFEEIRDFTRVAVEMGIDKVRLTGGEPLVRRGIIDLVCMLHQIEGIRDFGMTTNAILLPRYARDLFEAGLHRLNISLDTTDPAQYAAITRGGNVEEVITGIFAAREAGFMRIKLNCVIEQSPQEPDARQVADFGRKHFLEVRFIQRMETSQGLFTRVLGGNGGNCAECNRLRLSADGRLYPCLFNDLSFSVREWKAKQALEMALNQKPEYGTKSNNRFYRLGG